MPSRREFLERSALSAVGLSLPFGARLAGDAAAASTPVDPEAAFLDLLRAPDAVMAQTDAGEIALRPGGGERWTGGAVSVTTVVVPGALRVHLSAPSTGVSRLHLRWRGDLGDVRLLLGDAWERAYGDLEWRGFVPDRVMPWYFAAWTGEVAHVYGVRTGARAFCFWQADSRGISLWADVRSGGVAVRLGERTLPVCDVVCRAGRAEEPAFAALHAFCRQMCAEPRLPAGPVYGHNDWYRAYGNNSARSVLADAHRIVELSPTGPDRPFAVIDDGWEPGSGNDAKGRGTWDRGNAKFPDMPGLAEAVRRAGARPGIWMRPLLAPDDAPEAWRLSRDSGTLDPSVPEVLRKVKEDVARLRRWGFDLVKHDYTTFDVLGRWGFQMGASLTKGGWTYRSGPARTTAEVLTGLYQAIREAAADALVIGCNTVSQLSAGLFEICRIGDDTSGKEWARTRKMGVNALGFRGVQSGAFYVAHPDCVAVTTDVPWTYARQWLDLVSRSGTMLFVSLAPDALGEQQRGALRAALVRAARGQPLARPSDWERTIWPTRWVCAGEPCTYEWIGPDGITEVPGSA